MDTSPILPLQKISSTSPMNRRGTRKIFDLCWILTGFFLVRVLHHYIVEYNENDNADLHFEELDVNQKNIESRNLPPIS